MLMERLLNIVNRSENSKKQAIEIIWNLFEADEIALNSKYDVSLKGVVTAAYNFSHKKIG